MLVQNEACIFSHRMEGQYRSGIQLFLSGAPSISLPDKNCLVFRNIIGIGAVVHEIL